MAHIWRDSWEQAQRPLLSRELQKKALSNAQPPVPNSVHLHTPVKGSRRESQSVNLVFVSSSATRTMYLLQSRHHASCLTLSFNPVNVKRENSNPYHRFVVGKSMARRHVKVLCTPRKTSICRPWGIHAKYKWLCLLYYIMDPLSGNPHLHLTTKYKFLKSMFLRAYSTSHFPQGQSGHMVCGPFPP